jgi:hypothetical protein
MPCLFHLHHRPVDHTGRAAPAASQSNAMFPKLIRRNQSAVSWRPRLPCSDAIWTAARPGPRPNWASERRGGLVRQRRSAGKMYGGVDVRKRRRRRGETLASHGRERDEIGKSGQSYTPTRSAPMRVAAHPWSGIGPGPFSIFSISPSFSLFFLFFLFFVFPFSVLFSFSFCLFFLLFKLKKFIFEKCLNSKNV